MYLLFYIHWIRVSSPKNKHHTVTRTLCVSNTVQFYDSVYIISLWYPLTYFQKVPTLPFLLIFFCRNVQMWLLFKNQVSISKILIFFDSHCLLWRYKYHIWPLRQKDLRRCSSIPKILTKCPVEYYNPEQKIPYLMRKKRCFFFFFKFASLQHWLGLTINVMSDNDFSALLTTYFLHQR